MPVDLTRTDCTWQVIIYDGVRERRGPWGAADNTVDAATDAWCALRDIAGDAYAVVHHRGREVARGERHAGLGTIWTRSGG